MHSSFVRYEIEQECSETHGHQQFLFTPTLIAISTTIATECGRTPVWEASILGMLTNATNLVTFDRSFYLCSPVSEIHQFKEYGIFFGL